MNIEQANELKSSILWNAIVEEVDRKINFEIQKLTTCSPEDLRSIQVKIEAFRSIKSLPQDIIDRES